MAEPTGKKEVITEVTSVAEEEKKTNQTINVPQEEQLIQIAAASMVNTLARLEKEYSKLSQRAKGRVLVAILAMPTDGIPVRLQSDAETLCFGMGQRVISDRFILTQYHINKEVRKAKKEQEDKEKQENKENDNEKMV
jgi:hypothetical protein